MLSKGIGTGSGTRAHLGGGDTAVSCLKVSEAHAHHPDSGSPTQQAVTGARVVGSAQCLEPPFTEEQRTGTVLPPQGLPAHPSTLSSCPARWEGRGHGRGLGRGQPCRPFHRETLSRLGHQGMGAAYLPCPMEYL